LGAFLCALAGDALAWDEDEAWFDPAYLESLSLGSGTGLATIPCAEVIPHNNMVAGMDRFVVKGGIGLWDVFEIDAKADVGGNTITSNQFFTKLGQQIAMQGRMRLLRQDSAGFSLALGLESPDFFNSLGSGYREDFHAQVPGGFNAYAVATRSLSLLNGMVLDLGYGTGSYHDMPFGGLGVVAFPGLLLSAEYDGAGTNYAVRMMLSSQIKLDIDFVPGTMELVKDTLGQIMRSSLVFGVSYTEPIQWGWF
jgi:hypothetical protein